MLNLARIPGWTWIFVAMTLIMGSALIVGAAIERRRNRIKMVKRASAYKRQLIFNRALVAGLVMSLLVALVGCASGGGVTVKDSESSGFLPSTAEPAPQAAEPEGTEPAAEEADPNALSKVSMTFDTTGVDFETLYKEAFGDRKPTWANTSFTTRLPIRFDLSGYQDPFGFPIYADHDWLNGEYYQSLSDKIAEKKVISFDYLGTSESLKRRTELLKKQNDWRKEFEETLTDEERIGLVNEMRTQENLENILFTVMVFDALTEHDVFRKNNEEAIKAFEEFLEDIYDEKAEVPEDRTTGLPRLAEWEDGYEPTGDALQDMEHIVPSKNALKLKVFVQQLLTLDQETNGKIVTRKPSYYWTLEYSDNGKENATNPLLPSSSGSEEEPEKTEKLPENFLRAVKKDGVEARNYIMYNVVRDGKTIFSYGIGVEDMSIAFFTSGKTSKTTTPTTPAPATKTYSARVQHRWADGRPGPGYPAIPFGDYYVNGLVTGSNFSYTAPIYPGCTVSLTAINVTVEDHDLLYTIYYTAPKDRQKSSGGGSGSKWKPNPKPNPKPDQNPNPVPENPAPKPDGEGGKDPIVDPVQQGNASEGGGGSFDSATGTPGGPGVVQDVQQEHAKDENANQAAQEEAKQEQIKNEQLQEEVKDTGGTPGSTNPNDGSHTDGGTPPDTSESLRDTDGSKSSGGHITTTTTTINGDGTTTTVTTTEKVQDSGQTVSDGKVSRDDSPSSSQSEAASAAQSSAPAEASKSSDKSSSQGSGGQESSPSTSGASSGGSKSDTSSSGEGASEASSSGGNNVASGTAAGDSVSDGKVSRD